MDLVKSVYKKTFGSTAVYVHLDYEKKTVSISKSAEDKESEYMWKDSKTNQALQVSKLIAE
jgi:hypothetical protein